MSAIIGSASAIFFNTPFDGAFDIHFVTHVTALQPFLDNTVTIGLLSVSMCVLGKNINEKTRFVYLLALTCVARIPFYLLPLLNMDDRVHTISKEFLVII